MTPVEDVSPAAFVDEFTRVWPWLSKAIARYGPTHEREHVLVRCLRGEAQLWTCDRAALVTFIETHDAGLKELTIWLAAGEMDGVRALEKQVVEWGRAQGCHRVAAVARKGFERAFRDYRAKSVLLVKEI